MADCTHTEQIQDVDPQTDGCEECLEMGADWVHSVYFTVQVGYSLAKHPAANCLAGFASRT
jgi:hypothetical protein